MLDFGKPLVKVVSFLPLCVLHLLLGTVSSLLDLDRCLTLNKKSLRVDQIQGCANSSTKMESNTNLDTGSATEGEPSILHGVALNVVPFHV